MKYLFLFLFLFGVIVYEDGSTGAYSTGSDGTTFINQPDGSTVIVSQQ